jgi:ATP-dependent protease ClpP protease subunit
VSGTAREIENYLQLVKNMLNSYYEAYKEKLKKPEAEFKAKWDAGDFWMTAQKAVEWGFATAIKEPVKIAQALAAEIKASGSPLDFSPEDIISNQNKKGPI